MKKHQVWVSTEDTGSGYTRFVATANARSVVTNYGHVIGKILKVKEVESKSCNGLFAEIEFTPGFEKSSLFAELLQTDYIRWKPRDGDTRIIDRKNILEISLV